MFTPKTRVRIHRAGLGAALLALWLTWTTNTPDVVLWALFLAGLVAYVLPPRGDV